MLQPSISHLSIASIMLDIDQQKVNHRHLYVRTVEIIQLVEGPPPPRRITSPSSISSSDYDSDEPSSSSSGDQSQSDDCSSYCSSDAPPDQFDNSDASQGTDGSDQEGFSLRMKRILAWRESSLDTDPSLKRKLKIQDEHQDADPHPLAPKWPRSHRMSSSGLCAHSCPACDSFFPSRQCLRQHGLDAGANEACSAAVEYAFE